MKSDASQFPLQPALPGERMELSTPAGRVSFYRSMTAAAGSGQQLSPLVLIHSVNAAGSAAEMRPVYEHYLASRSVYAIDLPGFGFSERSDRPYTPRLMTDAVHSLVAFARERHQGVAVDALALSLGCEFLARAAQEVPEAYRSIALVSPTGFRGAKARLGPPGSVVGSERLHGQAGDAVCMDC
jgi:pimeloyl-ACP methyl ester carboxylesterase